MTMPKDIPVIESVDALEAINGVSSPSTQLKILSSLEKHSKNFIERSPFLVVASGHTSHFDASPRGDAPGFVKVLDDTTLLIPERPGNRLADTLTNLIENPALGLLMLIPGMDDTLRINGRGYITDHSEYLEQLKHNGKAPKLAIVVDIEQVYFHCPKAFIRSKLWNSDEQMNRSDMPTLGKMIIEQIKGQPATDEEVTAIDTSLDQDIEENLYH